MATLSSRKSAMTSSRRLFMMAIILFIAISYVTHTMAAPASSTRHKRDVADAADDGSHSGRRTDAAVDNACPPGSRVRDICEKCSKVTKNVLVYPLCCEGTVNARNWCIQFLNHDLDK